MLVDYLKATRAPRYSVIFAVPLLLLYEGLTMTLPDSVLQGVRNGADVLLKTAFVGLGGRTGLHVFAVVLAAWGGWLVWRDWRVSGDRRLRPAYFGLMLAESFVLAAIFGVVAARLTSLLLPGPLVIVQAGGSGVVTLPIEAQLVVSLGAGLYEELLFRVILVSGLLWLGVKLRLDPRVNVAQAVILGALVFSAFHYVGPLGDQFLLGSFAFRTVAGLLLSGIYVGRGFGVAAWTHALYDIGYTLDWG